MEFKLFTALIGALGKVAGGVIGIVGLPKAGEEIAVRNHCLN